MDQFQGLGLAEPILKAIKAEGYTTPTPIQAAVIPVMMGGQDVVGIAQTGTGKTASFVLPLLNQIAETGRRPGPKTCGALILAPTRELVSQIAENIRNYSRFMRVSVVVVVGGVKPGAQIRALSAGADIVVATPGRLLDHLTTGALRLEQTKVVVLDEADQMLDLGFMPAIRKIMSKLPKKRQTALMSATMPTQIRSLANDFLSNPKQISVAAASRPVELIEQRVVHAPAGAKRELLLGLLRAKEVERAIVFTRTKRGADRVNQFLQNGGLSSAAIHGNKSQGQRERALAAFRDGQVAILVATDIAARGIDIDDVSHVVNYELPNVPEAYVHRIGRTARAGRTGVAISLCDAEERGLLRDIEKLIGNRLDAENAPAFDPVAVQADALVKPHGHRRPTQKARSGPRSDGRGDAGAPSKPKAKPRRRNPARADGSKTADAARDGHVTARSAKRGGPAAGRSRTRPSSVKKTIVAV
ncbi:MAG: DEAD/DEAH box helicase [Parvibaculum sp.]